jgi:glycosyltransferase involved in cell wall biosynthesis
MNVHLPSSNLDFLALLIQSFGVSLVHIHHVLGYSFDLHNLINKLDVPFYLTVHDYMLLCPRINMMPVGQKYCGEPEPSNCNQCLAVDYPHGVGDIIWWRESNAWLFNDASVVICPSHDVAHRCQKYFPEAFYQVVSHEATLAEVANIKVPILDQNEPLRIAILGVLARHKGLGLIADTLVVAEKIKAPLQFQLIGYAETNLPSVSSALFSQTGHYVDAELIDKINTFNPHLILFPACCPETYSYTLTAALKSKYPVMASNLGALPERVVSRPWTWLMDWTISSAELIEKLCAIRIENFYTRTPPPPLPPKKESTGLVEIKDTQFYENDYLYVGKSNESKEIIDIRVSKKIIALVLLENVGEQPSPCAYIRLILPLIRERNEKFDLRWVTAEQVTHYAADVLICQRTAVTSMATITKIVEHCRVHEIKIVYDLDDLLLMLPEEHPEKAIYAPKSAAVFRWLTEANEVWVSTETLQQQVYSINPRTHVIPNYIDDKLWVTPKRSEIKRDLNAPIRLLYMGTQTHSADFELVKKALKRLKNEFAERIEINLIGILANDSNEQWYKTIVPPQPIGSGYPAFVNWICNKPTFDIGIAPLIDNEFNRCKSAIKFLDYSVLGLATVASDVNGYALIRNGENGFRVNNTEAAWYDALKMLITDSALRIQIQLTAQNEIFDKYGYESVAGFRLKLLAELLSQTNANVATPKVITLDEKIQHLEYKPIDVNRNLVAAAFLTGVGIEVGALHNPLPIPNNVDVRYVDRMDKPGLYEHYPELLPYSLVDVDFVDNGETLLSFEDNSQDFIIANHFLEHCEDPIATLKSFSRVLRTGGVVYLALPDMRATFDINRQRTTLEHLIKDHREGPENSRFGHYVEWAEFVDPHFGRIYDTREEIECRANELMKQSYSIHYHVWLPEDVVEMMSYCKEVEKIPFEVACFISKADEMIIILRKNSLLYAK